MSTELFHVQIFSSRLASVIKFEHGLLVVDNFSDKITESFFIKSELSSINKNFFEHVCVSNTSFIFFFISFFVSMFVLELPTTVGISSVFSFSFFLFLGLKSFFVISNRRSGSIMHRWMSETSLLFM